MFFKANVCGWFCFISGVETLQEYTIYMPLPFNGHDVLSVQLHREGSSCSFNIFLLWPFIALLKLGREQ